MGAGYIRGSWLVCAVSLMASAAAGDHVTIEYDALGRLRSLVGSPGITRLYDYDGAGNRILSRVLGGASGVGDGLPPGGADVDGDGVVAPADLAALCAAYGAMTGQECYSGAADLDGSGRVDLADVRLWYFYDPESAWLAGDWTGPGGADSRAWDRAAPDQRVDFLDLAVLARGWRQSATLGSNSAWLDIGPAGGDGVVDDADLAAFRANWLVGESRSPGAGSGPCGATAGDVVSVGSRARLELRSRDDGADGRGDVVLDLVLVDASGQVDGFQCVVAPDLTTLGLRGGAGEPIRIGGAAREGTGAHFLDLRPVAGGTLVTGAFLDAEPARTANEMVMCSAVVPRAAAQYAIEVRDARLATGTGGIESLGNWSGELSLDPVPAVPFACRNSPNPFNPATTIRWAIPSDAAVDLRVYDVRGRQVCVLVDGTMERGWHESRWFGRDGAGRDLASGLYFFRLRVGGDTLTGKMSLVR